MKNEGQNIDLLAKKITIQRQLSDAIYDYKEAEAKKNRPK